ncbi:Ubiquinone/menaquinone biosynthesis C-methylase UbiE [Paenibacillus sp. 1_12]|uniref:class I SAM-dependent methyltransferase n=1 Tax=Paenibacillus sp. 1_12 TaxID=1566278 RepID=UPI0008DF7EB4|nr:class I SAM-dependent methyltransferase [Paenibacillus sp. 1_12]SFL87395.1 Ubiquinone/menaquinone biosynthesis C-methylase UbiE [Paenibacillus sp. 1_12]
MEKAQTNGDFQGFVALHYDAWFSDKNNVLEYSFFKDYVVDNQGPALEVGCGTGRMLLSFVQEGMDVDGVDYSEDMLKVCQSKADRLGLVPTLYHQSMQQLDLPRKYHTIFIPGNTFNLLFDRGDAMEALRRLHRHLVVGGQLVLTLIVPRKQILNEQSDIWGLIAEVQREDKATIRLSERVVLDYWEQLKTNYNKYEVFIEGTLVEVYEDTIQMRWFYQFEFELMLKAAEFKNIQFTYAQGNRSYMSISACK